MRRIDVPRLLRALGVVVAETRGDELWACCPSHQEKTPSWSIVASGEKAGSHRCFGCGFGGGPPQLVSEVTGLDLEASRDWLAKGSYESVASLPDKVRLDLVRPSRSFSLPAEVRRGPLRTWPAPARRYLERRGFCAEDAARWDVGYAVDGRLGGRVVFPIVDSEGVVASYSARSFDGRAPRYLTPNRKLENPRDGWLFGMARWPSAPRRIRRRLVLTEGAIDAMSCEVAARRAGDACYVAALGGSDLSPLVGSRLASWGEVLLLSDPDAAGRKLATSSSFLTRWCRFEAVEVPGGGDANDLLVRDPDVLACFLRA